MPAFVGSQSQAGPVTGAFVGTVSQIDPDAQAYINTSGATDVTGINQFVLGVKALGLWTSFVCWPLRSSQSAGTGTVAYSLGGLGTFNGTLVNGPTWGADGVSFVRTSTQHITTLMQLGGTIDFSFFLVGTPNDDGGGAGGQISFLGTRNSPITTTVCTLFADSGADNITSSFVITPTPSQARPAGALTVLSVFQPATPLVRQSVNSGAFVDAIPSSSPAGATQPALYIGAQGPLLGDRGYNGSLAFAAAFSQNVASYLSALPAVYKSTLGIGLSLP